MRDRQLQTHFKDIATFVCAALATACAATAGAGQLQAFDTEALAAAIASDAEPVIGGKRCLASRR